MTDKIVEGYFGMTLGIKYECAIYGLNNCGNCEDYECGYRSIDHKKEVISEKTDSNGLENKTKDAD